MIDETKCNLKELKNLALFIADTREHELAIKTINHCCKDFKFGQIVFCTNKKKEELNINEVIEVKRIDSITSKDDYSNLILHNLHDKFKNFITHVLIVQTDGFIVNTNGWKKEFLDYDYIGAPWEYHPCSYEPPHPESTPDNCVGNGGFSIRSIKLIKTVHKLITEKKYPKLTPEDLFICRTLKPELDQLGIKFAPEHLAIKFSCENRPYRNQFGFHGQLTYKMNHQLPKL